LIREALNEVRATGTTKDEFLGFGAPAVKSAELLSVSTLPSPALKIAVVLDGAGAAAPSKVVTVVPKPTKSITEPVRDVVAFTTGVGVVETANVVVSLTKATFLLCQTY
jgi:hypothetical protein